MEAPRASSRGCGPWATRASDYGTLPRTTLPTVTEGHLVDDPSEWLGAT